MMLFYNLTVNQLPFTHCCNAVATQAAKDNITNIIADPTCTIHNILNESDICSDGMAWD